jgi:hypothetical protein
MWGVKFTKENRELWRNRLNKMMDAGKIAGEKSQDQKLLDKIVWPLTKKRSKSFNIIKKVSSFLTHSRKLRYAT